MKNLVPLTLALVAFALPAAAQPSPVGTATLTLSMGTITYADVFTPVPDGSLVQLVINFSGTTFAAPTAVDFLGGSADCAILWQGAFDSTTAGTPGSMVTIIPPVEIYADGTPGNYAVAGDAVIVRWFPALTYASSPTAPGVTSYGEYGYSMGDSTWVLPAAGGLSDLALVTVSADGPLANELGAATYTTLVPEPSAVAAWLAAAVLVAACFRRRR